MSSRWNQQQVYYPPATDTVLRLIALMTTAFLLQILARSFFHAPIEGLTLQFSRFLPTQILTHPLLPSSPTIFGGLIEVFFHSIVFYFFGSELERTWGRHNFLKFVYVGLLGGVGLGLVVYLIPGGYTGPLFGMDAAIGAVLVAYAILWPDRQVLLFFVIPIRMKWMVLLVFILLIFSGSGGTAGVLMSLVLHSGGALASALFLYYYARKGRDFSVLSSSSFTSSNKPKPPRPGLRDRLNEALRKRRLRKQQELINERIAMKDEVDRLLAKISLEGMDSLSRKEKAFLDKASKEF
ncbi:MAG: rhomboid family intramembrane serine protease [bacterium]|nr:rhomboid family intramembrane serine protease [bacterium]